MARIAEGKAEEFRKLLGELAGVEVVARRFDVDGLVSLKFQPDGVDAVARVFVAADLVGETDLFRILYRVGRAFHRNEQSPPFYDFARASVDFQTRASKEDDPSHAGENGAEGQSEKEGNAGVRVGEEVCGGCGDDAQTHEEKRKAEERSGASAGFVNVAGIVGVG